MFRILKWLIYLLLMSGAAGGGYVVAKLPRNVIATKPDIPSEVRAKPGRMAVIHVQSESAVRWHRCASANEPDVLILDDGKTLIFVAAQPGRYELFAWSAVGNQPTEAAQCSVTVQAPTPPDALVETLRSVWSKETSALRLQHRDALIRVYRQAADDLVRQSNVTTLNELYAAIRRNALSVLPADALLPLRNAIGEVLQQRLPTVDGPLTDELRNRCGDAFRAVVAALEQLETNAVTSNHRCVNCR